jgi:glycosyltransferase involved in cell wall biosynthesis
MLVVQNGIDTKRFRIDPSVRSVVRKELNVGPTDVILAHVARVHPMKDHSLLLDVAWRLPHVTAIAIGTGTEALPNLPNLRRLGQRDDVPRLLAASDIVVSSSAYGEGFSNAIAEGMAAGLVPVATDVGDACEIVGDAGFVVPPRAATKMASAIEALAALPREQLAHRGAHARERIERHFSLESSIRNFANLYMKLAARMQLPCAG